MKEARLQSLVPTNRNWIQRLYKSDEVAHHTDVQKMVLAIMYLCSRFSGYWVKEYALTWGGLELYVIQIEKSAEVIVVNRMSRHRKDKVGVLTALMKD